MVMKVVSEGLDVRDTFLASLRSEVARKKDYVVSAGYLKGLRQRLCTKCDITNFSFG